MQRYQWWSIDVANSFLFATAGAYLPIWIIGTLQYSAAVYPSMIALSVMFSIFASALTANLLDNLTVHRFVRVYRAIHIVQAVLALFFAILIIKYQSVEPNILFLAIYSTFTLFLTVYSISIPIYHALPKKIELGESVRKLVQIGTIVNWGGSVFILAATLPLTSASFLPIEIQKIVPFVVSCVIFSCIAIFSVLGFMGSNGYSEDEDITQKITAEYGGTRRFLLKIFNTIQEQNGLFLISSFLVYSAIYLVQIILPVHLLQALLFSSFESGITLLLILVGAGFGGYFAGNFNKKISLKHLLATSSFSLGGISATLSVVFTLSIIGFLCFLAGICVGILEYSIRKYFADKSDYTTSVQGYFGFLIILRAPLLASSLLAFIGLELDVLSGFVAFIAAGILSLSASIIFFFHLLKRPL